MFQQCFGNIRFDFNLFGLFICNYVKIHFYRIYVRHYGVIVVTRDARPNFFLPQKEHLVDQERYEHRKLCFTLVKILIFEGHQIVRLYCPN